MVATEGTQHQDHERLALGIPTWFARLSSEMGNVVEPRAFGFYMTNPKAQRLNRWVLVRDLGPGDVPGFLADVQERFGSFPVQIVIDNRQLDAWIGPLLVAAGCTRGVEQIYLAHVGPLPQTSLVPDLVIEPVSVGQNLLEYVTTKLKGFADSEEEPQPEDIEAQVALRRAELAGEGCFLLAKLRQEPVAVIACYEGDDRLLFHLATRVPYRARGIARCLLCHVFADSYARGCRSIILFTDAEDTPIRLYRRLGFIDEVYWQQQYDISSG